MPQLGEQPIFVLKNKIRGGSGMKKNLRGLLLMCLILAMGLTVVACTTDDGDDHDEDHHHDLNYEWSGIFELGEGTHTIKFNKNEGDESILVAFISSEGSITDIEHHAAHVMEAEAIDVAKETSFTAENEYTYDLELNSETAEFEFEMEAPGKYYVFTQHLPEEFDMEILNSDGEVLTADEPTEYEGDHDHDH